MLLLAISTLLSCSYAVSSGALAQDALGVCAVETSGASVDADGVIKCPAGMHLVAPPVRTDSYTVRTGDGYLNQDPDEYIPDTIMDIHVRTHNRYMKFLGIIMYAVKAGSIPREGCPGGCDGSGEEKVGSWEIYDDNFKTTSEFVVTHTSAKKKPFHSVFRFRTPPAGTGPIVFRVLLKQGATNGGRFYWPMLDGDLQVSESGSSAMTASPRMWLQGSSSRTCAQTCASRSMACDSSADVSLSAHNEVKSSVSCAFPLMSSCLSGSSYLDDAGRCYFNAPSLCGNDTEATAAAMTVDVCGAPPSGADGLCPCLTGEVIEDTFKTAAFIGSMFGICCCFLAVASGYWYKKNSVFKLPEVDDSKAQTGSTTGTMNGPPPQPKRMPVPRPPLPPRRESRF